MDDMFRKISGLLAKANGTDNENEANAFYAKAQDLMLKYAIDEATVRANLGERGQSARPTMVEYEYSSSDSNARGKLALLNTVARANRCRVLNYHNVRGQWKAQGKSTNVAAQWCAIVGYEADIEFVKMLYVSLLVQSARMGSHAFRASGRASGKSRFLTQYLFGFSDEIHARFAAQGRAEPLPAESNALVVRIVKEVDDAFADFFPRTKSIGFARRDYAANAAGREGGSRADIGNPGVTAGKTLRIGSGR